MTSVEGIAGFDPPPARQIEALSRHATLTPANSFRIKNANKPQVTRQSMRMGQSSRVTKEQFAHQKLSEAGFPDRFGWTADGFTIGKRGRN
jgi:hypothetical protein